MGCISSTRSATVRALDERGADADSPSRNRLSIMAEYPSNHPVTTPGSGSVVSLGVAAFRRVRGVAGALVWCVLS